MSQNKNWRSRIDNFIYVLILLSTLAIILQSDQELENTYGRLFNGFEIVTVLIFSLEYIYRSVINFRGK